LKRSTEVSSSATDPIRRNHRGKATTTTASIIGETKIVINYHRSIINEKKKDN
jgi:hypothetical protein